VSVRRPAVVSLALLVAALAPHAARAQYLIGPPTPACDASPAAPGAAGATAARPVGTGVAVLSFRGDTDDDAAAELADAVGQQVARRLRELWPRAVMEGDAPSHLWLSPRAVTSMTRNLGARWLLVGTLGTGVRGARAELELYDGRSGARTWRSVFEDGGGDLRAIEDRVVAALSSLLARDLGRPARVDAARGTASASAYRHYLLGSRHLAGTGEHSLALAVRSFEAARRADPTFAGAWSRLALAYALWVEAEAGHAGTVSATAMTGGEEIIEAALRVSPRSAEAWVARAVLREVRAPRTLDGARAAYERALALEPRSAEAHWRLGRALMYLGDRQGAHRHLAQALAVDADQWWVLTAMAELSLRDRQYRAACRLLNAAVAAEPRAAEPYALRAIVRLRLREIRDAYADAETAMRLGNVVWGEAAIAAAAAAAKDTAGARARVSRLLARFPGDGAPPRYPVADGRLVAAALVAIGDRRRALTVLEQTMPRGAALRWALLDPALDPLRADVRFHALVLATGGAGAREPVRGGELTRPPSRVAPAEGR
jgi:tetratricopeptide (TPR) repeat protein/TolB-like protein